MTPRLENTHQRAALEVRRRAFLSEVRQADAVERGANHQLLIVHDQWAVDREGQRLFALVELPTIDFVAVVAEIDAWMLQQVARLLGPGVGLEVRR